MKAKKAHRMAIWRERLRRAQQDLALVQIKRRRCGVIREVGYVLGTGSALVLLGIVIDGQFDGLRVLRYQDISDVQSPPDNQSFVERSLALLGEPCPTPPPLDLSGMHSALRDAGSHGRLLSLRCERDGGDNLFVGQLVKIEREQVWLRELDQNGFWATEVDEPLRLEVAGVTCLAMGSRYETRLLQVAESRREQRLN